MPGRLLLTAMPAVPGFSRSTAGRITPPVTAAALVLVLLLGARPGLIHADWKEVDALLAGAFGEEVARECAEYYSSLEIPEDEAPTVAEAVRRLVGAGYPSGCPVEYLRAAGELSRAGVDPSDLTSKISEGIAKKVRPERLMKVISQRAEALLEARALVLALEGKGVSFLDRQMAYRVVADYLLRGVSSGVIETAVLEGKLNEFPALDNVVR